MRDKAAGAESPEEKVGAVNPTVSQSIEVVVPEGAVELMDGDLKVRMHPDFPQVVDYRLGDEQMAGRLGDALTTVLVNEVEQAVTVAAPTKAADGKSVTYALTFPDLDGVSMNAVASVAEGAFTLTFTDLVDPNMDVNRLRIPNHDLVTVGSADAASQLTAGNLKVDRAVNGDRFENVADTDAGDVEGSWMVMANTSKLAAAFDNNASEDNRGPASTADRVQQDNNRWQRQIVADGATKHGTVWSGTWTWLAEPVEEWLRNGEETIGRDGDPFVTVKITADANNDGLVDWQDAGIATREIRDIPTGADKVKDQVVSRIPFNIVSQATHPFLRNLDDTKRISLATDNLGQKALLKGYQAEGHDSAHPDYAGHYNTRAGGLKDLKTLADASVDWNTNYGVHVNITESYSEAYNFSEELLEMPPKAAWGWMNQSYVIDSAKDLALGNVLDRFQEFYDERPENVDWLYVDVYRPTGWEAERFSKELAAQGWVIGTEWSDKMPNQSVWSHWAQDENYGGQERKGVSSDVIRFVLNSQRDTWQPHPILSNSNVVEFEGWAGNVNYNDFIKNVWARNLPVKFLQQSDIVKWGETEILFENGTTAASDVESVDGKTIPTDRTFTYDGADVYTDGAYLLPWEQGGEKRLYHYNIGGGSTTWELTDAWKTQGNLELFKLTDTGREKIKDVTPVDGKITIEGAEDGVAYVLYPSSDVPEVKAPNWGQGSHIADPGFFSGSLDSYDVSGNATIEKSARANFQAVLGYGESSISQELALPKGTYSAWAWVEIDPGQQRLVSIEASGDGITPAGYAENKDGTVVNTMKSSNMVNATASDEKLGMNFQRIRVTFTTDGKPVNFTVRAGGGTAKVTVDDLRVVDWQAPEDKKATDETVYFQDFENVDTGYYPFATGATNLSGDARTQLAEIHAPYSQKGWWGINLDDEVVENGKLNDNVLDGKWSLMANNENSGEILKTAPGALPFKAGHKYRVSFDYQTTFADQYQIRVGKDVATGGGFTTENAVTDVLDEQRSTAQWSKEFTADSCDTWFVAVDKLDGENTQHNMTMDNFRVEDLGQGADVTCVSGSVSVEGGTTINGGEVRNVTTTISSFDEVEVTGVTHDLEVPKGWEAELIKPGVAKLANGEASVATWALRVPRDASDGTITLKGVAVVGGDSMEVTADASITVIGQSEAPVVDPKVTVTPAVVEPGDVVTLALSGFAPTVDSSIAEVYVGGKLYGSTTINNDGNATATVRVSADAKDGKLEMEVRQWGAGIKGVKASVMVKSKVVPPTTPPPTTTPPTTPPTTKPPFQPQDVYTTPGYHTVNGRQWFTKCEPYSTTFRCWTSIWSTQVTHLGGSKFESKTGWFFNNLTYLPAKRSLWAGNPLAFTNNWTSADGRKWYTECDTAQTGRNGCRSYIHVNNKVQAKAKAGGGYTYVLVNKWEFNNIVLFK